MEYFPVSHVVTGLALALTFGGMTFFSAVQAPLVFTRLPLETAGAFIRQVFPWYYLSMGTTTLVALLALSLGESTSLGWMASLLSLALAGFVVARQVLTPRIYMARDAELAGTAGAAERFNRLHRLSVMLNALQWLAILAALILLLV